MWVNVSDLKCKGRVTGEKPEALQPYKRFENQTVLGSTVRKQSQTEKALCPEPSISDTPHGGKLAQVENGTSIHILAKP